jgi:L-iditol 2-dehydrogenase
VNPELDLASAALTEPLACVLHACDVLARAPARYPLNEPGSPRTVVILGAGPAGLLFVQVLRSVMRFDGTLLVADPNPRKRSLAERFGAEVIDPSSVDVVEAVAERTRGRRAEIAIEASGSATAFAGIPRLLRKQGTLVLYGHGHAGADLSVMNAVQFLEPALLAPTGASGGFDDDGRPIIYRRALRLIEEGAVDVSSLITHRYRALASVSEVFADGHAAPEYIKGVVLV